ncbi:MAG: siderophore-interacting protein [Epibacterium sp.]|nr:siderophore-interacting protein [Epibacterium sp.]NQX75603.1 siderophore-interacting protein [Epibacterium sp.]
MTIRPDFPLSAETTLPGLAFAAMRMVMLHQARDRDLPVIEDGDSRITLQAKYGVYSFARVDGGIQLTVSAERTDWLHTLKDALMEQLGQTVPDSVAAIRWSDGPSAGSLPPNFHFVTVQSVNPIGTAFLRVRIKGSDLSNFQNDAIHFRVVLPPKGLRDVEWPYVAENGATVWPKGDKALHRPVYTTRWVDQETGLMDFDVFIHEGGRITEWVQDLQPGDKVGIVGPGGGGIPDTRNILLYADETAFPAAARILEALPDDARGHATFLAEEGAWCAYPITAPQGVSVTWLSRQEGASLGDLALQARGDLPDHFLWFACEKSDVQRVRAAYKEAGGAASNAYIAAYWTKMG